MPESKLESKYTIERGIPFPGKSRSNHAIGRQSPFPFTEMQVGDSFFFESDKRLFSHTKLCKAMAVARRRSHFNLEWVKEDGGYRVFRLEGEYVVRRHRMPRLTGGSRPRRRRDEAD